MITVRKGSFETNSSSTHAICYSRDTIDYEVERYTPEQLRKVNKEFKIWTPKSKTLHMDGNIYTTLEDRLTWLLSSMRQAQLDNPFVIQVRYMLEQLMPNARFDFGEDLDCYYEFEDIEILWDDYCNDYEYFLQEENLLKFLCEGIVVWGNRDWYDWSLQESIIDIHISQFDNCVLRYSG